MQTLTNEDWENILQALLAYRHNPSFMGTYERVQSCVAGLSSDE